MHLPIPRIWTLHHTCKPQLHLRCSVCSSIRPLLPFWIPQAILSRNLSLLISHPFHPSSVISPVPLCCRVTRITHALVAMHASWHFSCTGNPLTPLVAFGLHLNTTSSSPDVVPRLFPPKSFCSRKMLQFKCTVELRFTSPDHNTGVGVEFPRHSSSPH